MAVSSVCTRRITNPSGTQPSSRPFISARIAFSAGSNGKEEYWPASERGPASCYAKSINVQEREREINERVRKRTYYVRRHLRSSALQHQLPSSISIPELLLLTTPSPRFVPTNHHRHARFQQWHRLSILPIQPYSCWRHHLHRPLLLQFWIPCLAALPLKDVVLHPVPHWRS